MKTSTILKAYVATLTTLSILVAGTGLVVSKVMVRQLENILAVEVTEKLSRPMWAMKAVIEIYSSLFFWLSLCVLIFTACWLVFVKKRGINDGHKHSSDEQMNSLDKHGQHPATPSPLPEAELAAEVNEQGVTKGNKGTDDMKARSW
jgi:hypothetical protein